MISGLAYAFSQAVIYYMFAIVFRFGAYQITLDDSNAISSSYEDILLAFFAVLVAATGASQICAFLPNYTDARLAANRIFYLLDREPLIDGYSEKGLKQVILPKKVIGSICD